MLRITPDIDAPSSKLICLPEDHVCDIRKTVLNYKMDFIAELESFELLDFYENVESFTLGSAIPVTYTKPVEYETYFIAKSILYDTLHNKFLISEFNDLETNDAAVFFLPLVYDLTAKNLATKTFCVDVQLDVQNMVLYVKYRWFPADNYEKLFGLLTTDGRLNKQLLEFYPSNDGRFTIFKYSLPLRFKTDIDKIINGKFLKLTKYYVENFLMKFWNYTDETKIIRIIKNDQQLRDLKNRELGMVIPDSVSIKSKPIFNTYDLDR